MIVFDIGANRGLFTDKCINLFHSDLKIITIEANPSLCNFLADKYRNSNNVIVMNTLMAENNEDNVNFYVSNADTISTASLDWINNSRFTKDYVWYEPIQLKSTSLDRLIELYGNPDLIKIDVEGYELEVIKGLTKKCKEICFEWAEEQYDNINKIVSHLQSLGYEKFGFIMGDEYMKKPELYTNWEESKFHENVNKNRKETWGMIWVK